MKPRYYIISGIIAYLVFLIVSIPAAPVMAQIQNHVPTISIQGVSGSLWNGSAAAITVNQQHTINNTHWQINGWRLFTGTLSAHIETRYQQQDFSGDFGIRPAGSVLAKDVSARLDAATLTQLAQIPLAKLSGTIAIQLDRLEWQPEQVPRITGSVDWNDAAVTVAEEARLGNLKINITQSDDQPVHATFSNTGGDIKLDGEANVSEDGAYTLDLNLVPSQGASENIRSSLGLFAKPKPNGSFQLENHGNLKQFGLI